MTSNTDHYHTIHPIQVKPTVHDKPSCMNITKSAIPASHQPMEKKKYIYKAPTQWPCRMLSINGRKLLLVSSSYFQASLEKKHKLSSECGIKYSIMVVLYVAFEHEWPAHVKVNGVY